MLKDYISKGKKWVKSHKKELIMAGFAGVACAITAAVMYNEGYHAGYSDCLDKEDKDLNDLASSFSAALLELIDECGFTAHMLTVEKLSEKIPDVAEMVKNGVDGKDTTDLDLTEQVACAYYNRNFIDHAIHKALDLKKLGGNAGSLLER